ncbi:hypothetical protein ACQ4M3_24325 [Leptolyngbya sp. AN03gr2]|uniref:hypothetical protein n=1 Tax=unclassified Leptolyngbya TaxID=2650499 RepID=UPI003D313B86
MPKPTPSDAEDKTLSEPYQWGECYVSVGLKIFPNDGNSAGPLVCIGAKTHNDPPILKFVRLSELAPLPGPIQTVLDQLQAELPEREKRIQAQSSSQPTQSVDALRLDQPSDSVQPTEVANPKSDHQLDLFNALGG